MTKTGPAWNASESDIGRGGTLFLSVVDPALNAETVRGHLLIRKQVL